jgi:hypothetical protein
MASAGDSYAQQLRQLHLCAAATKMEARKITNKKRYREIMDELAAKKREEGSFWVVFTHYPDFFVDMVLDPEVFKQLLEEDGFVYDQSDYDIDDGEYNAYVIELRDDPPTFAYAFL